LTNTIVKLLVGPEIPVWVKLLVIAALLVAVVIWWKSAYEQD